MEMAYKQSDWDWSESSGETAEDLTAEFEHYEFEPELRPVRPRPIPSELQQGKFARSLRRNLLLTVLSGVCCLILGLLFWWNAWAPDRPLWWLLSVVGLGLLAYGIGDHVVRRVVRNPFRYVLAGIPMPARVLDIRKEPVRSVNGQPSHYVFIVTLLYRDPQSDKWMITERQSDPFSASFKNVRMTTFRVGDLVTMVYMRSDPEGTLELYPFLGLRPDYGIISSIDNTRLIWLVVELLLTIGFVVLIIANCFAVLLCEPMRIPIADWIVQGFVGALTLGGLSNYVFHFAMRFENKRSKQHNDEAYKTGDAIEVPSAPGNKWGALLIAMSLTVMGAATLHCMLIAANMILDRSKPIATPVSIISAGSPIEFQIIGQKHRYSSPLLTFLERPQPGPATALLRQGAFGWPWVERFAAPAVP